MVFHGDSDESLISEKIDRIFWKPLDMRVINVGVALNSIDGSRMAWR
jgi:hypothetical protein